MIGASSFQRSISIELDLKTKTLESYKPTNTSIELASKLIESMSKTNSERSIILAGAYGAGKSYLSLFISSLIQNGQLGFRQKYPELWNRIKKYPNFVEQIKNNKILSKDNVVVNLYGNLENIENKLVKKITSCIDPLKPSNKLKNWNDIYGHIKDLDKKILIVYDEFSQFLESNVENPNDKNVQFLQILSESINNSSNINLILITHKTLGTYTSETSNKKQEEWRKIEGRFAKLFLPIDLDLSLNLLLTNLNDEEIKTKREYFFELGYTKPNERKYWLEQIHLHPKLRHLVSISENNQLNDIWPLHPLSTLLIPIMSSEVGQNNRSISSFLNSIEINSLRSWLKHEVTKYTHDKENINKNITMQLHNLWDYFSDSIRQDVGFGGKASIWGKVQKCIEIAKTQEYSNALVKIIKTIGTLEICSYQSEILPSEDIISFAMTNHPKQKKEVDIDLKRLKDLGLVRYHKLRETYSLYDGSGVNWEEITKETIRRYKITNRGKVSIIKNHSNLKAFIPRRYNSEFKITRFFYPIITFLSPENIKRKKPEDWKKYLRQNEISDGSILYIPVDNRESVNETIEQLKKTRLNSLIDQFLFVFPSKSLNIDSIVKRIYALEKLKKDKEFLEKDTRILGELTIELQEAISILNNKLEPFIHSFEASIVYLNSDMIIENPSRQEIDKKVSKQLKTVYHKAPIINSELFNKHNVSHTIKREIQLLLDLILNYEGDLSSHLTGNSAREVFYRVLTFNDDIEITFDQKLKKQKVIISETEKGNRFLHTLKFIRGYFSDLKNDTKNLNNMINKLKSPPFGIRKGVMPFFILFTILNDYEYEYLVTNKEQPNNYQALSGELLYEIVNSNKEYLIAKRRDTMDIREKNYKLIKFLNEISDIQMKVINNNKTKKLSNLEFQRSIEVWFYNLQPFVRRTELYLNEESKSVLSLFENICENKASSIEFLKPYNIFNQNKLNSSFKEKVKAIIQLENSLQEIVISNFFKEFGINIKIFENEEIFDAMMKTIEKITEETFNVDEEVVYYKEPKKQKIVSLLKNHIKKYDNDSFTIRELTNDLGKHFTSLLPKDWNDNTIIIYSDKIKELIKQLDLSKKYSEIDGDSKIVFTHNGKQRKVSFSKQKLSPLARTLLQSLEHQIEMSGRSLNDNEKINILNELIKSITSQE